MDTADITADDIVPAMLAAKIAEPLSDEEWQQFLAVGLRADLSDPRWGAHWQRAPVLLSY